MLIQIFQVQVLPSEVTFPLRQQDLPLRFSHLSGASLAPSPSTPSTSSTSISSLAKPCFTRFLKAGHCPSPADSVSSRIPCTMKAFSARGTLVARRADYSTQSLDHLAFPSFCIPSPRVLERKNAQSPVPRGRVRVTKLSSLTVEIFKSQGTTKDTPDVDLDAPLSFSDVRLRLLDRTYQQCGRVQPGLCRSRRGSWTVPRG